jgi:hypothetical protein
MFFQQKSADLLIIFIRVTGALTINHFRLTSEVFYVSMTIIAVASIPTLTPELIQSPVMNKLEKEYNVC